jgi:hypothetical protein
VLSGKVSKFPIAFTLGISLDYAPYPIIGVLRDRHQSESEVVFKILPLVHRVPMLITFSLFIGFEYMSNDWKVKKVNYEFVLHVF